MSDPLAAANAKHQLSHKMMTVNGSGNFLKNSLILINADEEVAALPGSMCV